jgi:hypothetical protein
MTDMTPPGWYHAEGDAPGTHRYWDGSSWIGGPELVNQPTIPTPAADPWSGGPVGGYNPAEYRPGEPNPAEYNPAEYNPAEYNPAEYSPAEYSPAEPNLGGYAPGAYAPGGYGGQRYTEASQATMALVFSILGFFCCQLLCIAGWYTGSQELKGIRAGRRDPSNKGTATAGMVIGIVGTLLMVVVVLFYAVFIAAGTTGQLR